MECRYARTVFEETFRGNGREDGLGMSRSRLGGFVRAVRVIRLPLMGEAHGFA
jgi:hypothetical protein